MTLVERIVELARRNGDLDNHALGELDTLLDRHVNTSSTDQSRWFLYGIRKGEKDTAPARISQHCAFEPHYIKEKGANTAKLATDKTTLLKIWRKTKDRRAELVLRLTDLRTQLDDYLGCRIDDDGRIRASINIAGTESARHTAHKSNTGSGYNLHTTPAGHKHLFRADDGYWMGSLDLSGADGWTIACECAALGDPTMLDDLRAGLKPAQLVALLYKHGADANKWSRIQLLAALSTIKDPPWLYLACKRVIWGTCLTGDHEVLTLNGWIQIEHLRYGVPIVTWRMEDRTFRWSIPRRVIHYPYYGQLLSFRGNSVDLTVTEEHRMPFMTNGKLKVCTARELAQRRSCDLPLSGFWEGGRRERSARLIAAIQSDGHYNRGKYLVFTLRKKRKIERLQELLTAAGIRWSRSSYTAKDGKQETRFYCKQAPVFPKKAGLWMLDWDADSLGDFVDEYAFWDGNRSGAMTTVFSRDKEQLMWLGLFARLSGRGFCYQGAWPTGKGSVCHRMSLNNRAFAERASIKVDSRPVKAHPVHCVETDDGFFLVRRGDKIMITGNCYGMAELKMSEQILEDSFDPDSGVEPVYVEPKICRALQNLVHTRYPGIRRRQDRIRMLLERDGCLEAANGMRRQFFGRKDDPMIQRDAFGWHPQVMTTWMTELAWLRLWRDPENRDARGESIIQPLLLVHDSLLSQWPKEQTPWACAKLREWFTNSIEIAGTRVTIPFSGHYGPTWAHASDIGEYKAEGTI